VPGPNGGKIVLLGTDRPNDSVRFAGVNTDSHPV
jgi:hypothetical protein